jgi:hypothetical protein
MPTVNSLLPRPFFIRRTADEERTGERLELKAERRKPSGEKPCDIEDTPSLTGVLAHFRLH